MERSCSRNGDTSDRCFRGFFGEIETVTAELTQLNPHIAGEDAGFIIMNLKAACARSSTAIARPTTSLRTGVEPSATWVEGSKGTIRLSGDGKVFFRAFGANVEEAVLFD